MLGERFERQLHELLETLMKAKYTRNRLALFQQANLVLDIVRYQMRLEHDLQWLRSSSYTCAARAMHEIGSMIGGWLNSGRERA